MVSASDNVVAFVNLDHDDKHYVGEKAAGIGGMINAKFSVLPGFVVTQNAYFDFLRQNHLDTKISHLLGSINFDHDDSINQVSKHIKNLINKTSIPQQLVDAVIAHYEKMGSDPVRLHASVISGDPRQKIRGSVWVEDVVGEAALLASIRDLWSGLFDRDLLIYRNAKNINHLKSGVTVAVQHHLTPHLKGKIFTEHNKPGKMLVEVEDASGVKVSYEVDVAKEEVKKHSVVNHAKVIVRDNIDYTNYDILDGGEILALATYGGEIEKHFYHSQEIDWILSDGKYFISEVKEITYAAN
ncbi:MAG TPA: PEP/pyruvate-binding domain-containing protein [Patescibacteria group bacterium]|nr:PEP/pyruvate-binding domain-containing protein [Patescibacteria group bacterium]